MIAKLALVAVAFFLNLAGQFFAAPSNDGRAA